MITRRSFAFAVVLLAAAGCQRTPPPVLGTLPSFSLVDQHARAFGSTDLAGHVWIANFVFTRCPTVCPVFTAKMATLQATAKAEGIDVRLVSFSVDPAYDTPERLAEYAARYGADPEIWSFLTGDPAAIKTAIVDGLKVAAQAPGPDDDLASIFHGTHFVLIDDRGRIRGYYDSSEDSRVAAILEDARVAHKEPARSPGTGWTEYKPYQ